MIQHYIKIAFRNLLRYKTQSVISILGLAIGFTFFALSMLWIHYELTYDSFHEGAERIYLVQTKNSEVTAYPLAHYLKEKFPEIESSSNMTYSWGDIVIDNVKHEGNMLCMDELFFDMFGIKIVEGDKDFLRFGSKKIAITEEAALRIFGNEYPIGKEIDTHFGSFTISAIITGWEEHSNFYYEFIHAYNYKEEDRSWGIRTWYTYIKLKKRVNFEEFSDKLCQYVIENEGIVTRSFVLTPLTKVHYQKPIINVNVKLTHVVIFSIVSILIIFCALFNYLTIFVSRLYMRLKETALRKICGATNSSLFILYSVELFFMLLLSLIIGMAFIEILLPSFKELSGVKSMRTSIYIEAIGYMTLIILLALLTVRFAVYYVNKRTLYLSIKEASNGRSKNVFRKFSVILQLIVGLGIMFCATIMMKQLDFLRHTDIGVERKNRAVFNIYDTMNVNLSGDKIASLPMVTDVIKGIDPLAQRPHYYREINEWEGKSNETKPFSLEFIIADEKYIKFHGLNLLEGELLNDKGSMYEIVLNETAVRILGWHSPIGKKVLDYTVVGVIKDFYGSSYETPIPIGFITDRSSYFTMHSNAVLFKYEEGTWPACKKSIEKWMDEEHKNISFSLQRIEEIYDRTLKSENSLFILLSFVSCVCMLISFFGVFSLVTLTCEQRRKEIGIRKVNGAKSKDILLLFLNEYLVLLLIAAVIAFSVSYFIMKSWIESFILQTEISWWLYAAIFCFTLLVMFFSVFGRVWKAARQNPAEVIKSE